MGGKKLMYTLKQLKKKAIIVEDGMKVFFPQFSSRQVLYINEIDAKPKTFAYNNSVVAFVDEYGSVYVIPNLRHTQKTLVNNGYEFAHFYVPFSNWDYPVDYKERWKELWKEKNRE